MQKLISLMSMPGDVVRRMLQVGTGTAGGRRERLRSSGLVCVSGATLLQMVFGLLACLCLNGLVPVMAADISAHQRGVLIQGPIQKGDYARIIQFIRQPDNYERFARTVFLDSPGGDLVEVLQISHLLNKSYAFTFVALGSRCSSGCFILWMSGVSRHMSRGATLGVHRVDPRENLDMMPHTSNSSSAIARHVDNYLFALGTPRAILDKMNATPSTELFVISPSWLAEQKLLTAASYDPSFFDTAQDRCGPEPFDVMMKDQTSRTYDSWVLQFKRWNACIDLLRARNQKADSSIIAALIDLRTLSK